jgi:hypothetical protein
MIQRIQSVYLALVALCSAGLFGADVADTDTAIAGSEVFNDAELTVFDSPILIGGVVATILLAVAAIFLFRNRRLQMILCLVAILITLAYSAYGGLLWGTDSAGPAANPDLGVALPPLAIIFALLARRAIGKDERLVRSADRLR